MGLSQVEIYLTKKRKVEFTQGPTKDACPVEVVASFAKNLEALGFTVSKSLFDALQTRAPEVVQALYNEILPILKKMVGAHRRFRPMYPNFPAQVMEASSLELFFNAMAHYWGAYVADVTGDPALAILPAYEVEERAELEEATKLKVIDLGTKEEFHSIFGQLVGSNSSLSESDKEIVAWFVRSYIGKVEGMLPAAIPQKETLATLVGLLLPYGEPKFLLPYVKTATDVLRVAVVLSGGDVSLAEATKFKKFDRKTRRFLLEALNNCSAITEDMLRWGGYWTRLGEILHPGEYKARFPKVFEAFDVLRNNKPFDTFNSKVELGLQAGAVGEILGLLSQRPGVFARRLDHALRASNTPGKIDVVDEFLKVADQVSTPVLLQVYNHFKNRPTAYGVRSFFPKGNVGKVQVSEVPLPPLPAGVTSGLEKGVREVLVNRFGALPSLGKVYLDPSLKTQIVPFAMRSASKSLRTIARGSRVPLPDKNTIRFFLWWKDGTSRTDIDLTATGFDENWSRVTDIAYYNLRDLGCCHSGDITSAPNGACEFIDIDIQAMTSRSKTRYVTLNIYSFTQQNFCDLPECFAGWMGREAPQSGEIFDARTVEDKIDLAAASTVGIPLIIDLVDRVAIWADIALTNRNAINNSYRNRDRVAQMSKAIATLNKPTLFDLFSMHVEARGIQVPLEEADTVFSLHKGITPYDIDRIMSEFMA